MFGVAAAVVPLYTVVTPLAITRAISPLTIIPHIPIVIIIIYAGQYRSAEMVYRYTRFSATALACNCIVIYTRTSILMMQLHRCCSKCNICYRGRSRQRIARHNRIKHILYVGTYILVVYT